MIIKNVRFIKSAVKPAQYPVYDFPEIAFAGRSNVGKSSLINTLIQRKKMVKTSSKPGCTRLINFFLLNEDISFADLPGYGYAKVSKKTRAKWGPMVERYLSFRKNLSGLILLIDIRRDPGREESDLIYWLKAHAMPYLIVLTKSDKLSRTKQQKRLSLIRSALKKENTILFSARSKSGRNAVLEAIENLISIWT